MKKFVSVVLKSLIAGIIVSNLWIIQTPSVSAQSVPDYYYANYKFVKNWDELWDIFSTLQARQQLGLDIDVDLFSDLTKDFENSFKYLPQDYKTTYEKCLLLSENLSKDYSYSSLQWLMWNSCYKTLIWNVNSINSAYTVKASASANPNGWSAPLTVTFDARSSVDPSSETIPTDNYFRYYRDENGVDTPMWKWNVINYTFNEAGKFIVHLVVRSSNVGLWILDWEKDLTINVSPKAANIVVYANTRKMPFNEWLKIWISEAEKWIVFDGSATMPTWWRTIKSHKWTIINPNNGFSYSKSFEWSPSFINVPLNWNWQYKVTLTTVDNESNTTSETFNLNVSDPVAIIKQTPSEWTTSSTFTFDWATSYSLSSKLNAYMWEIFNEKWDKLVTDQWKKTAKIFNVPGNYLVRLTATDMLGNQNIEIKNVYVESTTPTPQFTISPTNKRLYPSEFTLDASNSSDVDVLNWVDSLEYHWDFDTENYTIVWTEDNNRKIVVQFNENGAHKVKLTVTDLYWKHASITKTIEVKSVLRPEIKANPNAITRWLELNFNSEINKPVFDYSWDFWDWTNRNWQDITSLVHVYAKRWIYTVTLSVYDTGGDYNTVTEKVFIWEVDYPIAAYRVRDSWWYYIQAWDICKVAGSISGQYTTEAAYSVDRYSSFTIDPSISVNTQWTTAKLTSVYQVETVSWTPRISNTNSLSPLTQKFNQTGCHFVDLTIADANAWKQDKARLRFNVKNALPKLKNITVAFPQYDSANSSTIWFSTSTTTNQTIFEDDKATNLTVKVTAVDAMDPDGSVSRLRFYYYNIDDPDRILEYKDTWISTPYVYFVIPRIAGEYKFWVMIYDNDGWMVDSEDIIWSWPTIYFPNAGNKVDIPTVTLKVSSQFAEVWDTVTYTIVSKSAWDIEDFETNRTFYYDFDWDWIWDLTTKKNSATYTFTEPNEDWFTPRAAVEYRWFRWQWEWGVIRVKNWVKPILLSNSYKNVVIFRDLSLWTFVERQICFDTAQCNLWNNKYKRTHIVATDLDTLTWGTKTDITKTIKFIQKYPEYGNHNVSLYLKSIYWIEVSTWFTVKTSENVSNWRIAPGVNLITIPETTFNNGNPEIFLSSAMNNKLVLYLNHENGSKCFIDKDISQDGTWDNNDGITDNDVDYQCNTLEEITYEPSYESTIWRIYFTTSDGQQVYKNFYVSFEWYVLELDETQLSIYHDITTLINGLDENGRNDNVTLKSYLDVLRKNIQNKNMVSSTVIAIYELMENGALEMDAAQNDLLHSVLDRLSNDDIISSIGTQNAYEVNKAEILAILPSNLKTIIQWKFADFEENESAYDSDAKFEKLESIFNDIMKANENDAEDVKNVILPSFCNILEYYSIAWKSQSCNAGEILDHYDDVQWDTSNKSGLPGWVKIIIIVLVWWVLIMWWVITFFAIKARINNDWDEES